MVITSITDRLGIRLEVGCFIRLRRNHAMRDCCIARIRDSGVVVTYRTPTGRTHRTTEPLHAFGVWCRCGTCRAWGERADAHARRELERAGVNFA